MTKDVERRLNYVRSELRILMLALAGQRLMESFGVNVGGGQL